MFEKAPDGSTTVAHDEAPTSTWGRSTGARRSAESSWNNWWRWGSRSRRPITKWPPASTRSISATPTRSPPPTTTTFKFVVRNVASRFGYIASFMPKPIEAAACTPVAVSRQGERVLRSQGGVSAPHGLELHRGAAAARARVLRHHQSPDQQLQAAGARLRGAGQCGLVDAESFPAGAHPRPPRARHPASGCRTPPATPIWRSRSSWRLAWTASSAS